MMDQSQESAQIYADIIRESLAGMMVNSQQVDATLLARVRSIQQFDSLKVILDPLKHRTELLAEDQVARITRQKQWGSDATDSMHLAVLERGEPLYARSGNSFRAVIPFNATKASQKCHAVPLDYTLGPADRHMSLEHLSEATTGNWRRSILIFVIFTAVAIAIAAMMFQRHISTPVDRLVIATREMQKRNLTAPFPQLNDRAPSDSHNELQFLARQFDAMRRSLDEKIAQLDQMNSEPTIPKPEDVEGKYLIRMFKGHRSNINLIARLMDVDRKIVYRKLAEYSLDPAKFRE
jgi:nitrate/nitrite-specific signal transduction histidine kinase